MLASVQFGRRRDVNFGSPFGEFLLGHMPGFVWSSRQTLIKSLPLLDRRKFEVADHDSRADVRCRLTQSRAFVSTPKAVIDNDIGAEFEGAHPYLDQPTLDYV